MFQGVSGGLRLGEGEYSPPKITVKRASWARGLRPRPQFAPIQGRKGFSGRGIFGAQVFSQVFSLSFPSFDSDPGPPRPLPPAGQEFFAGENILAGPKYFVLGAKKFRGGSCGKIFGTVRRNLSGS